MKDIFLQKFFNRNISRKVPEVILLFWVIKLLTTAMGESTSDFMVHNFDPIIAVIIGFIGFCNCYCYTILGTKICGVDLLVSKKDIKRGLTE